MAQLRANKIYGLRIVSLEPSPSICAVAEAGAPGSGQVANDEIQGDPSRDDQDHPDEQYALHERAEEAERRGGGHLL